jgi:DNA-binding XRE family transcriptional regulator
MAERKRFSSAAHGHHDVHFYESPRHQAAVAAQHLGPALAAATPAIVVAEPIQARHIDRALTRAGHDVASARKAGSLIALTPAEVHRDWMRENRFDDSAWRASVGSLVHELAQHGEVRCYGAAVGSLWAAGRTDDVAGIESAWGRVCRDENVSMLCGYPSQLFASSSDVSGLAEVCHAHDAVLPSLAGSGAEGDEATGAEPLSGEPSIAVVLRRAREGRGWSREDLAHHSGVSYAAIAQIETGRRTDVRLRSLVALADALGVTVDALLGRGPSGRGRA